VIGIFWGYQTRIADSISAVFTESPFEQGYDLTIGTSERGDYNVMDSDFKVNILDDVCMTRIRCRILILEFSCSHRYHRFSTLSSYSVELRD